MVTNWLTTQLMRRSLVLTDESARHPFRASLPQHVREEPVEEGVEKRVPWRLRLGLTSDDLRGFAGTYCASLIAVSVFIA